MIVPASKVCKKCKKEKPASEFYVHGVSIKAPNLRLMTSCKICYCAMRRKKYWGSRSPREKRIKQMAENRQFIKHTETEEQHQARLAAQRAEWHTRDPRRRKAQRKVNHQIRQGKIPRSSEFTCRNCPAKASQYEHLSLEKEHWLDIIPVCRRCAAVMKKQRRALGHEVDRSNDGAADV